MAYHLEGHDSRFSIWKSLSASSCAREEIGGGDRRQEHKIRQGQSSLTVVQSGPIIANTFPESDTGVDFLNQKWEILGLWEIDPTFIKSTHSAYQL